MGKAMILYWTIGICFQLIPTLLHVHRVHDATHNISVAWHLQQMSRVDLQEEFSRKEIRNIATFVAGRKMETFSEAQDACRIMTHLSWVYGNAKWQRYPCIFTVVARQQ